MRREQVGKLVIVRHGMQMQAEPVEIVSAGCRAKWDGCGGIAITYPFIKGVTLPGAVLFQTRGVDSCWKVARVEQDEVKVFGCPDQGIVLGRFDLDEYGRLVPYEDVYEILTISVANRPFVYRYILDKGRCNSAYDVNCALAGLSLDLLTEHGPQGLHPQSIGKFLAALDLAGQLKEEWAIRQEIDKEVDRYLRKNVHRFEGGGGNRPSDMNDLLRMSTSAADRVLVRQLRVLKLLGLINPKLGSLEGALKPHSDSLPEDPAE